MRARPSAALCVFLSLAGLALCIYLGFVHIALLRGDVVGGAACGTSGIFNCHAVTGGPYGSFRGMPLAFWGLLGYLATLTLALIAWQFPESSAKALSAVASLSLLFVLLDAGLLAVMVLRIKYLCPVCLTTYGINLLLLWLARAGSAQPWRQIAKVPAQLWAWRLQPRVPVTWVVWGVLITGALGTTAVMAATTYMQQGVPGMLRQQIAKFLKEQRRVTVDVAGDPVTGGPNRPIQIVEFSDFFCPSCQRAFQFNPIILAGHRQDVSLTFKNFPLDSSCNSTVTRVVHEHACQVAAAGECAQEQGKFWALHDVIFGQGSKYKVESLDQDAARVGLDVAAFKSCMDSGRGLEAVKRDIAEGARLGVSSTPSYFINGVPVVGILTPTLFEEFFRALRRSES